MRDTISPQDSEPWRIRLFGGLEVVKPTGEVVRLNGRKAGELLAYLALAPDKPHLREKLPHVLWDPNDVGHAATRFRQEIATLRSLFPETDATPPLLIVTPTTLQVQPGTAIDAVHFTKLCSEAKRSTDPEQKLQLLTEAYRLFQAELLNEYDSKWIIDARLKLNEGYERALIEFAEIQESRANFAEAEETLRKLLARNPLNEETHVALMQLFAKQGHMNRVRQQFVALERMLRGAGLEVTEGTRALANSLQRVLESRDLVGADSIESDLDPNAKSSVRPRPRKLPPRKARMFALISLLVVGLFAAIVWNGVRPRSTHPIRVTQAISPSIPNFPPSWNYLDEPKSGELPDSEGTAIARGPWGGAEAIYVTGMINTNTQDTDILTVKVSDWHKGVLWRLRYSSPEGDCDRAKSLCVDGQRSLYVLGETYVPPGNHHSEGWYLTLLRYFPIEPQEKLLWDKRPKTQVSPNLEMQVIYDLEGGCYVGATALVDGKPRIMAMRYDISGQQLWQTIIPEGTESRFSRLVLVPDGQLVVCGTMVLESNGRPLKTDGVVIWLDRKSGKVIQRSPMDANFTGSSEARNAAYDRGSNIVVTGIFDSGQLASGGKGRQLGVAKFNPDGKWLWTSIVKDTGPNVNQNGFSINFQNHVAVGGTEHLADGTTRIVLAWFDTLGNNRTWRYPLQRYRNAGLNSLTLNNDESIRFVGQVSKIDMHIQSSLLMARVDVNGKLVEQSPFAPKQEFPTFPRDSLECRRGFAVTGQAGVSLTNRPLLIGFYRWR